MSTTIYRCPFCDSDQGYYENRVLHYRQFFDYKNEPIDASEGNDTAGKRKFCIDCDKNLTKEIVINQEDAP